MCCCCTSVIGSCETKCTTNQHHLVLCDAIACMQHLALIEPMTSGYIEAFMHEHGLPEVFASLLARHIHQPQEDFLQAAPETGTFAVADGVTLDVRALIAHGKSYPHPSPSGAVARAFCRAVIEQQGNTNVDQVFRIANNAVQVLDEHHEEDVYTNNPTGRYAATGAFVIIRDTAAHYASICDSYIFHFDTDLRQKHATTGICDPYAVINGEEHMVDHLEQGVWHVEPGDTLMLCTDGFAPYMTEQEFLGLFRDWSQASSEAVRSYTAGKCAEDPLRFGHERSLIAVRT